MFGLFKPKAPLAPWEKAWTEYRLGWYAEQLGPEPLAKPTLLPGDDRLPPAKDYDGAVQLLKFLGEWMQVDTSSLRLQIHGEGVSPESIGKYDQSAQTIVQLHESQFDEPDSMVAVLAWQLANEALTGGQLNDVKLSDLSWTTDLLPVYYGLGVFAANYTLRQPLKEPAHFAWWSLRQRAYMPGRVFGFALALRDHVTGKQTPELPQLRQDAAEAFQESNKYLQKTNDTVFTREPDKRSRRSLSLDACVEELSSGTASAKIAAMWELTRRLQAGEVRGAVPAQESAASAPEERPQIAEHLRDCLRHRELDVRAVAATTVPLFELTEQSALDVADTLRDRSDEVRVAAAGALGAFAGVADEALVQDLTNALKDSHRMVMFNAARSLTHFGDAAASAKKVLLRRLRQALVECRESDAQTLLSALDSMGGDTTQIVESYFDEHDGEYRDIAMELLEQVLAGE